jgi:Skp family chaperone for outer membrane proteins
VQTQYKAQIDAYNARSQPLQAELQNTATEIRTLQQNNTAEATVNQRIQAFQARQQAIQTELAPLAAPFERPLAYAEEQISAKLDQATRAAMNAKRVNILLRPEAVAFAMPTSNITADITQQLNALVPTASIAVPANWQPGGQQGAQAAAGRPAATPPARRNQGR